MMDCFRPGAVIGRLPKSQERNIVSLPTLRTYIIVLIVVCLSAVILSALWKIPYVFTVIGFMFLIFVGHVVTIDDDLPGGWSNPDGNLQFPWHALAIKAAVLLGLIALTFLIPALGKVGT